MSNWDTDVSIFTKTNQNQKQIMKLTLQIIVCFFTLVSSAHAEKAPVEKPGVVHAIGRGIKQAFTAPNIDRMAREPRQTRKEEEEEAEACIPGVCHSSRTVIVHDEVHTHYVRGETKHISFGDPTPRVTEETVLVPNEKHITYKYAPLKIIEGPKLEPIHETEVRKVPRTLNVTYEYDEWQTIEGPKLEPIHETEVRKVPRTHNVSYEYDVWQTIEGPKLEPVHTTEVIPVPRTRTLVYAPALPVAEVYCPPVPAPVARTISIGHVVTKSCNWCMQNATVVSGVRVPCHCNKAH